MGKIEDEINQMWNDRVTKTRAAQKVAGDESIEPTSSEMSEFLMEMSLVLKDAVLRIARELDGPGTSTETT